MTPAQQQQWVQSPEAQIPLIIVGSQQAALEWSRQAARLAVCSQGTACMTCLACKQASAWQHPDTVFLQDDGDLITERTISLKAIQALLVRLSQTSFSGRQLAVIPRAERLPREAATALLKTLEELPAHTRVVLTTQFPNRLFQTLRSRSQFVRLAEEAGQQAPADISAIVEEHKKGGLTDDELETVATYLEQQLRQQPQPSRLLRSFLRLRDYYKIKSSRGNVALAADVLVASLMYLRNTRTT